MNLELEMTANMRISTGAVASFNAIQPTHLFSSATPSNLRPCPWTVCEVLSVVRVESVSSIQRAQPIDPAVNIVTIDIP